MKSNNSGFFWPSYADLMTSLFFIMLVLYVLTFLMLKKKDQEQALDIANLKHKLEVYDQVESNLMPLKNDTLLFHYEEEYKRFTLAFDVHFESGKYNIIEGELDSFTTTSSKIKEVGIQLSETIDLLAKNKLANESMKNVSYLIIISGYASRSSSPNYLSHEIANYEISYKRALNLWLYWKNNGIDFEAKKYDGLIDLQIAGNGWGGVGRFPSSTEEIERKNQRFIIQIVPKIGNTK